MRIISGSFKGKKLFQPKDKNTRPLKDLTKESIFNIIKHSKKFKIDFSNSLILDLFSGVGSFGIECLSRGVKKVIFIENYEKVLPILAKNLLNLKSIKNFEIINKDIYLSNIFAKLEYQFDIIFLDPPYNDNKLELLLDKIKKKNILKDDGIIIMHRHKKDNNNISSNFHIIKEKIYGISKIIFLGNSN